MNDPDRDRNRRGLLYGFGAYGLWGLVPLFWPLVKPAGSLEILASRVVWSLVFAAVLIVFVVPRGWWHRIASRRNLLLLAAAAAVVSVNWGVYIWAVNHDHVTEAALGYYINPIVSIMIGVLVLGERLARWQWIAVGIALIGVVLLSVEVGRPPWIALTLAFSFATYGLLKKRVNGGAVETLTIESGFLFLPALGYLIFLQTRDQLSFTQFGIGHSLLLIAAGLVTLIPLLLFSAAATRLPLSVIGLLQYVTPTAQFLLGVLYFHEQISTGRWFGFALVWLALILLTVGALIRARRRGSEPVLVS